MTSRQTFPDHFSSVAQSYATARPTYPVGVYAFVADIAPATGRVWDCATGNGQAAVGLSGLFHEVYASDASEQQIENALAAENVAYSVQAAERTDFPDSFFDAVTVAQALHWFDIDAFSEELLRVLKPGGVFVTFTYSWFKTDPRIDAIISENFLKPVSGFWPVQNEMAWKGYPDIRIPLERIDTPSMDMSCDWSLGELLAYLSTWSAATRYLEAQGPGLLETLADALEPAWGDSTQRRTVHMDFLMLAWRNGNAHDDRPRDRR